MIDNIKLTEKDDQLSALQIAEWNGEYTNSSRLCSCVGTHVTCNGFIYKIDLTTYNVLCCRVCSMRIEIPKWVETYRDLRQWSEANYVR